MSERDTSPTRPGSALPEPPRPQAGPAPAGAADPQEQPELQVRKVPESTLDDAVEATFPASDPVAVVTTKTIAPED